MKKIQRTAKVQNWYVMKQTYKNHLPSIISFSIFMSTKYCDVFHAKNFILHTNLWSRTFSQLKWSVKTDVATYIRKMSNSKSIQNKIANSMWTKAKHECDIAYELYDCISSAKLKWRMLFHIFFHFCSIWSR